MPNSKNLNLKTLLEGADLGLFQIRIIAICFSIAALDGFDTQSIAFVAPALRHEWDVPSAMFGPLFGIGLFGTLVGSIALSPVADRIGRKPLILISTALFGVMTLLSATATSIEVLGVYRLVAGLGLGGAIPNIIALVSEYTPPGNRSTAVVVTFAGFPLGAVLGGMASARIIPVYGWEGVFVLGGLLPLVLIPIVLAGLPESLYYLAKGQGQTPRIRKIMSHIAPKISDFEPGQIRLPETGAARQPVRSLFTAGRANWTVLLWLVTFIALLLGYFLVNWIPLLLVDAGMDHHQAIMGVVLLNLGGIIGSIILGRVSDKQGPFGILTLAYGLGTIAVAGVGLMINSSVSVLLSLIFLVGLCVTGAQLNIVALAANYYPTYMRSTGIGWSMGMGRVGSIVGPTVGGALMALGLVRGQLFYVAAIPAAIACAVVFIMSFNIPSVGESLRVDPASSAAEE